MIIALILASLTAFAGESLTVDINDPPIGVKTGNGTILVEPPKNGVWDWDWLPPDFEVTGSSSTMSVFDYVLTDAQGVLHYELSDNINCLKHIGIPGTQISGDSECTDVVAVTWDGTDMTFYMD